MKRSTTFAFSQAGKSPEELVSLPVHDVEAPVQSYLDDMNKKQRSIRYINVNREILKTYFRTNGFKKEKEIDVERYHQPARYRKKPEYIPNSDEVFRMVNSAMNPKWKAIILALYTTGLRNSTLRAVRYGDIKEEIEQGKAEPIHVPVFPEMKKIVADACKNLIPYHAYFSKEVVDAMSSYFADYERINGFRLSEGAALFAAKGGHGRPMKERTVQDIVN